MISSVRFALSKNNLKINRFLPLSSLVIQPRSVITNQQSIRQAASKNSQDDKDFFNQPEAKFTSNLPVYVKPSFFDSIKERFGMQGGYRFHQPLMAVAALRLYLCIQYQVDYDKFFKKLDLPDVMYSFCLVTFLHVWMVSVALMQYGRSGQFVRRLLIKNMWKDIETRAKKLNASMNKDAKKNTYENLNDVFRTCMFGLDEGLLSDDTVLAGAIWRSMLDMRPITDMAILGEMCDYIRKNVNHLENMTDVDLLKDGIVSFVDFDVEKLDHNKVKGKINEIIRKKDLGEE